MVKYDGRKGEKRGNMQQGEKLKTKFSILVQKNMNFFAINCTVLVGKNIIMKKRKGEINTPA